MSINQRITIAYGDGIGPEIMEATIKILKEANCQINFDIIEIGKIMYERGFSSGIPEEAWKSIHQNKIILKAPITTPQGGGYKSLNVTMRKILGLYANIRPSTAYFPYVNTKFPDLDLVVVRENEEDIYAGVEYRQTHNEYSSIKIISRTGSEKIIRYAFEYAVKNNRKKISCFTKDNIMKFSDGIFHKVFDEIKNEYPNIETDHYIIDIATAKIAAKPSMFDVIVTENLYGDIISDVAAEISGSVGMAGSANIGEEYAMFEAIHGSAPDIANKDIANPSGLINAAIMMLVHIDQPENAALIHNAWLKTIEDGIHTSDIYSQEHTTKKVGTQEFADELIKRLGQQPKKMGKVEYKKSDQNSKKYIPSVITNENKILVGVDVYVNMNENDQDKIADRINSFVTGELSLKVISVKGLKVWPRELGQKSMTSDSWRLRFVPNNESKTITHQDIIKLLEQFNNENIDFVKIENLYIYDDKLGFSLAQGE